MNNNIKAALLIVLSFLQLNTFASNLNLNKIEVVSNNNIPTIYIDSKKSDRAVMRAVIDLQKDITRVSSNNVTANIVHSLREVNAAKGTKIIVGTLGHSDIIDKMVKHGKINDELLLHIKDKWESSIRTVIDGQIVIIGSDTRGTIYGIYDLSKEIGVSPWYYWADLVPQKRNSIHISANLHIRKQPDVKYRGIFINDEINLMRWSKKIDPNYNIGPETYKLVYELMLRLNLNILKPAMHTYSDEFINAPNWDEDVDPLQNIKNAKEYGIIIGSAQPMFRKNETEWAPFIKNYVAKHNLNYTPGFDYSNPKNKAAIEAYWEEQVIALKDYEVAWSLGMRGKGDGPMEVPWEFTNQQRAQLLTTIVRKQQEILAKHINDDTNTDDAPNVGGIFQTFEVYKEVLNIYNAGLKHTLPEDVAIIWSEDNHANIRQFPDTQEQQRKAGNTLYYHLSYWGSPKSYLWLYTTPLSRINSELDRAYANGIGKAWIFNVGDIKPAEMALNYVADKAWDIEGISSDPQEYITNFNSYAFGSKNAVDISNVITAFYQLGNIRRPEFLGKNVFTQKYFGDEWTIRINKYTDLFAKVNRLYDDYKNTIKEDAFYQLIAYPIRAAYYANLKFYYQDLYNLYKEQKRGAITNKMAQLAAQAQENEFAETKYYNQELSSGKWNGIMDPYPKGAAQQDPPDAAKIENLQHIAVANNSQMGVVVEAQGRRELKFSSITQDSLFVDIFSTGATPISWNANGSEKWIKISKQNGVTENQRVWISIDWENIPQNILHGTLLVKCVETQQVVDVKITADNTRQRNNYTGYIEADGYISIEAENFDKSISQGNNKWEVVKDLGRESDAVISHPLSGNRITENISKNSPELQYKLNFQSAGTYKIIFYRTPTLDGVGMRFAFAVENDEPTIVWGTNTVSGAWYTNVLEGIEKLESTITVNKSGENTLRIWMVDPGVSIDQIVIETEPQPKTYLAPPQSYCN